MTASLCLAKGLPQFKDTHKVWPENDVAPIKPQLETALCALQNPTNNKYKLHVFIYQTFCQNFCQCMPIPHPFMVLMVATPNLQANSASGKRHNPSYNRFTRTMARCNPPQDSRPAPVQAPASPSHLQQETCFNQVFLGHCST